MLRFTLLLVLMFLSPVIPLGEVKVSRICLFISYVLLSLFFLFLLVQGLLCCVL